MARLLMDDVEWAFGQVEDMMYQADEDLDSDIDPERVAARINTIASDVIVLYAQTEAGSGGAGIAAFLIDKKKPCITVNPVHGFSFALLERSINHVSNIQNLKNI